MTGVEAVDSSEPLGAKVQSRAVALDEGPPEASTHQEADQVPGPGRQPDESDHRDQLYFAPRGHDATDHHGRLARNQQADECPGLEEGEGGYGRIRPPAQRARGVLERAVEVGERHHSDDDEHVAVATRATTALIAAECG